MPQYTMFRADGVPVTSEVAVDGWRLSVTSSTAAGVASPAQGHHELTGALVKINSVRVWLKTTGGTPPPSASTFWPRVGDEVIVAFSHAAPARTVLAFNPKEISWDKTVPWQKAGAPVRQGNFRVVVKQKGYGPLGVGILFCSDREVSPGNAPEVVAAKIL